MIVRLAGTGELGRVVATETRPSELHHDWPVEWVLVELPDRRIWIEKGCVIEYQDVKQR